MTQELWAEIEGFENYAISNLGMVLNKKRQTYLKPSPDVNGYLRVSLYRNNQRNEVLLHRLVAQCFLYGYSDGKIVRHLNEDKNDCRVDNLAMGVGCREPEEPTLPGRISVAGSVTSREQDQRRW